MFFHVTILISHPFHQWITTMIKSYLLNQYQELFFIFLLNVYIIHIIIHYHLIKIFNYLLMVYLFIHIQYYLIILFNMYLIYLILIVIH